MSLGELREKLKTVGLDSTSTSMLHRRYLPRYTVLDGNQVMADQIINTDVPLHDYNSTLQMLQQTLGQPEWQATTASVPSHRTPQHQDDETK